MNFVTKLELYNQNVEARFELVDYIAWVINCVQQLQTRAFL